MTVEQPRPADLEALDHEVRGRGPDRGTLTSGEPAHPDQVVLASVAQRHEGTGERRPGHGPSAPTAALVLGATGVVFGDIGTSPLHAMRESLAAPGIAPGADSVLGMASLIFWAPTLVVTLMSALTERLYAWLHRKAASPTAYFGLPTERVVTLSDL